jgi:hemolysin activation/secretion protein
MTTQRTRARRGSAQGAATRALRTTVLIAAYALTLILDSGAHGQTSGGSDADAIEPGPIYAISSFSMRYVKENPLHPSLDEAMRVEITLGRSDTGFVAPRPGEPTVSFTLADPPGQGVQLYHASGLQHIFVTLRDYFIAQDLIGIYVGPDPRQITEFGRDLRPDGDTSLEIVVTTGIVSELRTIGAGPRSSAGGDIDPSERINNPLHDRIRKRSPVKPFEEGESEREDLLRKSVLDSYLFHLGRHPGRRVDAALAAAEEVGTISLDYLITENRPLVLYAQISNTGTDATDYLRERFGLLHTQLTNNDDILTLDYSTANFDEVHAFTGSYEAPFPYDRIRWRVQGNYIETVAQELGAFRDDFRSDSWSVLGEIDWNFFQHRELFLDLAAGVRYTEHQVRRSIFGGIIRTEGNEEFLIPYLGLRLERRSEWYNTQGMVNLEWQSDATGVDERDLILLGRDLPDEDWFVLRWNIFHSVYLEPLLNREAWRDPSTPETSTLAHELYLSFRGQYAFDNRMIPQEQQVVGGLYSVRGYPQSAVAGDNAYIGTVEYRFHLPRAFALQSEPGELFGETFRYAPQYVYGTPDWDLVLKGFLDLGYSEIAEPLSFEDNETLIGAGIGLELLYRRNLNVRVDWGFALDDLEVAGVDQGANRLYFVATLLF